jgi:hypothetical protein
MDKVSVNSQTRREVSESVISFFPSVSNVTRFVMAKAFTVIVSAIDCANKQSANEIKGRVRVFESFHSRNAKDDCVYARSKYPSIFDERSYPYQCPCNRSEEDSHVRSQWEDQ